MNPNLIHQRVAERCARSPDRVAIRMGDEQLSYETLESQAGRLAQLLIDTGCKPGDRVGLFIGKSPRAIIGMLAALKAGCPYVPIDVESPALRVARVLDACEPVAVLVDPRGAARFAEAVAEATHAPRVLSAGDSPIDVPGCRSVADMSALDALAPAAPHGRGQASDTAHILFTSGSTGIPKGVVISHSNVCAFLDWACAHFSISEGDRLSGHSPFHFDLSTFDIYGSLSEGATLYLVPPEMNILAPKLAKFIRDAELTQWFSVPSVLSYMMKFDVLEAQDFPHLKHLIWCGEVMPTPTLQYYMARLPHVEFTNLYGPTEATIASSFYTVPEMPANANDDIPIGRAIPGESVDVLDDSLAPVDTGTIGEICIGGVGLSAGYWLDPEKTDSVFQRAGETRWYRTGDLGKRDAAGLVHYLGRVDSQIKSRGHRIELGEIESALHALDDISEAVVVAIDTDGFEGKAICCAFTPAREAEVELAALRRQLAARVPKYMLPMHWMTMEHLPKNANGKHDRPAIRQRFEAQQAQQQETQRSD